MNNFTKEELKYLHETIHNACEYYSEPDIAYDVKNKLKLMLNEIEIKELMNMEYLKIKYMEACMVESK